VKVIKAFDPNPPLRQDCDEILKPFTGAASMGAVLDCDALNAGSVSDDGEGSIDAVVAKFALPTVWPLARPAVSSEDIFHAPAATTRMTDSQMSLLLNSRAAGRLENPPLSTGPADSMRKSPALISWPSAGGEMKGSISPQFTKREMVALEGYNIGQYGRQTDRGRPATGNAA
jgi:hypothetical protein